MRNVFSIGIAVSHLELFFCEPFPIGVGDLHWRVRRVVGEVGEEGLLFVGRNELHCLVGKIVDDEPFTLNLFAVVFEGRTEIVAPMSRAESIELIKASSIGMVRILHSVVPFAEGSCGVALRLEGFGNRGFVKIETLSAGRRTVDPAANMVASGQELGSRGGAHGTNEEALKLRAVSRERIDMGCFEVGIAVKTQVAPALVVCEDDDDIGLLGGPSV